jgi:hypothetical protein
MTRRKMSNGRLTSETVEEHDVRTGQLLSVKVNGEQKPLPSIKSAI